jgi:hypothetical protein
MVSSIAVAAIALLMAWGSPAWAGDHLVETGVEHGIAHHPDDGFDDPKLDREWSDLRRDFTAERRIGEEAAKSSARRGLAPGGPTAAPVPLRVVDSVDGVATGHLEPQRAAPAAASGAAPGGWPYRPRLKVSYQRFSLASLPRATAGAAVTPAAPAPTSESFESLMVDVYPMSGYLRVGTSTQFAWQSGHFSGGGDYFIAQSFSSGFQIPGRVTPFAELIAGGGYMRRVNGDSSLASVYWQVGIEGGVEVYTLGRAYTSVAVGYLRTGSLVLLNDSPTSLKQDTWTLKLGIGI